MVQEDLKGMLIFFTVLKNVDIFRRVKLKDQGITHFKKFLWFLLSKQLFL